MTSLDLLKQRGQLPAKSVGLPAGNWHIPGKQKIPYCLYQDLTLLKAYQIGKVLRHTFLKPLVLTIHTLLKRRLIERLPCLLVPEVYNSELLFLKKISDQLGKRNPVAGALIGLIGLYGAWRVPDAVL